MMNTIVYLVICLALSVDADHSHLPETEDSESNKTFYLHPGVFTTTTEEPTVETTTLAQTTTVGLTTTENATTTIATTEDYSSHEEVTKSRSATDEHGCFTTLRDEYEENCYHKFEQAVLHEEARDEAERQKKVCCFVEEYEKCALNGYQKSNCEVDQKAMKDTLKSARILVGAMANISCSKHRGMCASGAEMYTAGVLTLVGLFVMIL